MRNASYGNNAEVGAGQMASTKGTNPGVMHFGQMMVSDHSTAQSELAAMAQSMSVSLPQGLDSPHMALKAQLATMSGYAFDSLYIQPGDGSSENSIVAAEHDGKRE